MKAQCVIAILAGILILGTVADQKHCSCDLRFSKTRLEVRDDINSLPVLVKLPLPPYRNFISVPCRRVLRNCPRDCLAKVQEWMGGNLQFTGGSSDRSGQRACEAVLLNATPDDPIHVYASYVPSVCGGRSWQYVAPLCCWKVSFPGYPVSLFLHNDMCEQRCPPHNQNC